MAKLSISFMVLQAIGLWTLSNCSSSWKLILHKIYGYTLISGVLFYGITTVLYMIKGCGNIFEILNAGLRALITIGVLGKMWNVHNYREEIIDILETLEKDRCLPRDNGEILIQNENDRAIRTMTIRYWMFVNFTISLMLSQTIINDVPVKNLPRKIWVPYDYSHGPSYWFTFLLQSITLSYMHMVSVGFDTLISGIFLELSSKLILLQYRFMNLQETLEKQIHDNYDYIQEDNEKKNISKIEKMLIRDCVSFHITIYNLAKRINATFGFIIFGQILASCVSLCLIIQTMSQLKIVSSGFFYFSFYMCVLLTMIFLYCYCANEVAVESEKVATAVFAINWVNFTRTTWKSGIIIACRSSHPITFTVGSFITLSLDSFKSILKAAYSVFNSLQSLS